MGNKIKRFSICLVLAIATMLCFVPSVKQDKVTYVKADPDCPITNVVTEMDYMGISAGSFLYALCYDETIGSIHVCDIDNSDYTPYSNLTARISIFGDLYDTWILGYYWDPVKSDYYYWPNTDLGYSESTILTPGTYVVYYEWQSNGAYTYGEVDDHILEIKPYKETISFMDTDFAGCIYSKYDEWMFTSTPSFYVHPEDSGEVYLNWYYMDGEQEVQLSDKTDAGMHGIYPKIEGPKASYYELESVTAEIWDEGMMGYNHIDVNMESPIPFEIQKLAIDVTIKRGNLYLTMYEDGDPVVTNTAYYCGKPLPYIAETTIINGYGKPEFIDRGIIVEINCWKGKYEVEYEEIEEIGNYFFDTADLTLISDTVNANNYVVNPKLCKVAIEKRGLVIDVMGHPEYTEAHYTGAEYSIPEFEMEYYAFAKGEWDSDIQFDDIPSMERPYIMIDYTEAVREVGSMGYITVNITDTDHFYFDDGGAQASYLRWEYIVMPGYATIEMNEVATWYHRETITDWHDKFDFTVTTTEFEGDEVEIESVWWYSNGEMSWIDFEDAYPSADQVDRMMLPDNEMWIKVITTYSMNGNFQSTVETFHFTIPKAPVYVRTTTFLTYNGNWQAPDYEDYRFYIYEVTGANMWHKLRPDLPEPSDYLLGIYTDTNRHAGKYDVSVELQGYLTSDYEIVYDDDSMYEIHKAGLYLDEFDDTYMTYGDNCWIHSAYYDGFVNEENEWSYLGEDFKKTYQYNTMGFGVNDDLWLDAEELTTTLVDGNPYARYDVPAGHYYIRCVLTAKNYEASIAYSNLFVQERTVTFRFFESEEDYIAHPDGGFKGEELTIFDIVATYTYDGQEHAPFVVIDGLAPYNGDVINPTIYVTNRVNADDDCRLTVNALNNSNYTFSGYNGCTFAIEKANLTVTPDSGLSKVYNDFDPELTYSVEGAVEGEKPTFDGALSRTAGNNAGTYEINQGTLDLDFGNEVNNNYNLIFNGTPVLFTIEQKEVTANFGLTTKEYTSENVNPDFTSFTGVIYEDKDDVKISYVNDTVDVGSHTKTFKLTGDKAGNYVLTTTTIGLTITQATMTYTAKLDGTNTSLVVEYDELEHVLTVEPTGIKSQDGSRVGINITENAYGTTAGTYYATLELTGDKKANYKLANDIVTWTITPKGVDISAFKAAFADTTVTYDGAVHIITIVDSIPEHYTYKFWFGGEIFTGASEVGTYNIQIEFTSDDETNYPAVPSIYNKVVINPRTVTLVWGETTFTYNGKTQFPEVTLNNVVDADKAFVTVDFDIDGATHKGSYNINATNLYFGDEIAENYVLDGTTTHKTMIIEARAITVTADNQTTTYGDAVAELTAQITGTTIVGDTDIYTVSCIVKSTSNVGDYTINVIKGGNTDYDVTCVPGTYTVTPADITIRALDKSTVYGVNLAKLEGEITSGELVGTDTIDKLVSYSVGNIVNAGTYPITVESKGNANYNVTTINGTYTITKKAITVTIDDKTSVYGDAVKGLTATTDVAPIGNDVPYTLECAVEALSEVGTYDITGKVNNTNYEIDFVKGTYTITARPITIAIADKTSVYGDAKVKTTFALIKGSYAGDDIAQDVFELICNVNTTTHVGYYNITGNTINDNYNVTYINGTSDDPNYTLDHGVYTVTERAITVTINDATSIYGDARAQLTGKVTVGNVVNNDNVYRFTADIDVKTPVGTYLIAGEDINNDYDVTFVPATYTVTKRNVTVTIADKTSVYGDDLVELTSEAKNIVNNDDVYTIGSVVTATSDVGEYAITGEVTNNNYTVEFTNGTYTLTKRAITVTFEDATSVYGDNIVAMPNEVTAGTIVGEDNPYDIVCDINNTTAVGTYVITGTCTDDNYDITFVPATYTITKRDITVTIDGKTSVYGDEPVARTASVTLGSIVNNDEVYELISNITNKTEVGNYVISGTSKNDNYTVVFNNAHYAITARAITVTIDDKTSTYGDNAVALTAVVTGKGIVNEDNVYTLHCVVDNTSAVNTYAITGTSENANYDVTFVDATYTVTKRVVTLTWTEDEFVYDEASHKPVATAGNLVPNDVVAVTVTGEMVEAGDYTATATELSNVNYALPQVVTHGFIITKPATYDKPLDVATMSKTGADLTQIFKNIDTDDANAKLELTIGEATVTFDKATIQSVSAKENVVLKFNYVDSDAAKEIYKKATAVFEITMDGATFENGTVTVTTAFENNAPFGKEAKLYYIDANGKKVDMKAEFVDGKVIFSTNHFSTFAVVYQLTTLSVILIILLILVVLGGAGACVFFFVIKKKK